MKIDLRAITDRQVLSIRNAINMYTYIQTHRERDDEDFRDVFTEFYLSSQGVMRKEENQIPFFRKLRECDPSQDLVELVEELYEELPVHKYEFSFATKLLHTVNNDSPIYDSKVRDYLKHNEGVDFWLYYRPRENIMGQIRHDWVLLKSWYQEFLKTPRAKGWVAWFDNQFPDAAWISPTKKVDFIIFGCN